MIEAQNHCFDDEYVVDYADHQKTINTTTFPQLTPSSYSSLESTQTTFEYDGAESIDFEEFESTTIEPIICLAFYICFFCIMFSLRNQIMFSG